MLAEVSIEATPIATRVVAPGVMVVDNLLQEPDRALVHSYLRMGHWQFGWKSKGSEDTYSFWHIHYAGYRKVKAEKPYDCLFELEQYPILQQFWKSLAAAPMYAEQTLTRCYANGQCYGSDGTLHRDSSSENATTAIYYPHAEWEPNWAGETVIFNEQKTDILAAVYPKPNRLLVFKGNLPHVARGVSRTCPVLRIVLVFKTDILNDKGQAPEVS